MKPALLTAAGLLLVAAAPAGPANTLWSDAIPPERFQQPALVPVAFLSPGGVAQVCTNAMAEAPPPGTVIIACTGRMAGGQPLVVLPHPCIAAEHEYWARIACHELAHANGWGREHPL